MSKQIGEWLKENCPQEGNVIDCDKCESCDKKPECLYWNVGIQI